MGSLILQTTARLLKPLLLVASLFFLLRGHDQPGGGFVGGLLASAAFALQAISFGTPAARRALFIQPQILLGAGLATALASGLIALFGGRPFLTGQWLRLEAAPGQSWSVGTVLLFDLGVYLVVIGAVLLIVFTFAEEPEPAEHQAED